MFFMFRFGQVIRTIHVVSCKALMGASQTIFCPLNSYICKLPNQVLLQKPNCQMPTNVKCIRKSNWKFFKKTIKTRAYKTTLYSEVYFTYHSSWNHLWMFISFYVLLTHSFPYLLSGFGYQAGRLLNNEFLTTAPKQLAGFVISY